MTITVYHVIGTATTIEGRHGLRIDANVDHTTLGPFAWIQLPNGIPHATEVLGADEDGWPVVANPVLAGEVIDLRELIPEPIEVWPLGAIGLATNGVIRGPMIMTYLPIGARVWVDWWGEDRLMQVVGIDDSRRSIVGPL